MIVVMPTLYKDKAVTITESGVVIPNYYFPKRTARRIPWAKIRGAKMDVLSLWSGKWRLWGKGIAPYWFNWDAGRLKKTHFIVLDTGETVQPAITPDNPEIAMAVIESRLNSASPPKQKSRPQATPSQPNQTV